MRVSYCVSHLKKLGQPVHIKQYHMKNAAVNVLIHIVMIRVNCVKFNMTAADAQYAQLDIGGL